MRKLAAALLFLAILLPVASLSGRNVTLAAEETVFIKHTIEIAPELDTLYALVAVDVDGDQDVDIVGANGSPGSIVWWENDGSPATGAWPRHAIGTTSGSRNLAVADLDGDEDIDVVAPDDYSDEVLWFENDGTPEDGAWTEHSITSTAVDIYKVAAADLDGDSDIDVVGMGHHTQARNITWYENDGAPADGGWQAHVITSKEGMWSIETVDMDLDSDSDLLVAANDEWGLQQTNLFYYLNNGDAGWEYKGIETGISALNMLRADAGDVDGDLDMDVVATYTWSATSPYGSTELYEHNSAEGTWTDHSINEAKLLPIHFADMDNDLDLDVIGLDLELDQIVWLRNDGTPWDDAWDTVIVEASFDAPGNAVACDIDGDGDLDVIGADYAGGVYWWEQGTRLRVFLPFVTNQS